MTDVIFLLLIFFMITSTVVSPNAIKVLLPQGKQQTSAKPLTRVIIDKDLNYYAAFGNDKEQALALAAGQKTVLFFGGLTDQYEGEGYDRESLAMPANQLRLLDKICEINPNVAVVSFSGAPYDMAFEKKVRGLSLIHI